MKMAACCQSYLPVKSSVYNQRGENYFQQLGVYNHMNTHLRRVLQAKCVVDSKNPRYAQKQSNYKYLKYGSCLHKCQSDDNVARSARHSQYHMIDILKSSSTNNVSNGRNKSHSFFKGQNHTKTDHPMHSRRTPLSRQTIHGSKPSVHLVDPKGSVIGDYENDHIYSDYDSSFEASTSNHSMAKEPKLPSGFPYTTGSKLSKSTQLKLENLKYLKFLHDITQDIIKSGVHRDEEIINIIQKHLAKNLTVLSKKKMLKKLSQLKACLEIANDDEEEQASDTSTARTYSSVGKKTSIGESEANIDTSKKSDQHEDDNGEEYDDNSNASQVSEESIEWQSEIESVINEDDASSEKINSHTA